MSIEAADKQFGDYVRKNIEGAGADERRKLYRDTAIKTYRLDSNPGR